MQGSKYVIVVHGGAGTIKKQAMTPQLQQQHKSTLLSAISAGQQILKQKGTALDAVEAAVRVLQDSQKFNAGRGAVLSAIGINQLDASIMDGKTRKAGAVASTTKIKNPISAARKVMEKSKHVILSGEGADQFAAQQGLDIVQSSYFFNQLRQKQLQLAKWQQKIPQDQADQNLRSIAEIDAEFHPEPSLTKTHKLLSQNYLNYGTVGAVALDKHGNLAAATSTGGMTNKLHGRIGDSPIIGAGCYANNKTCAVSSTGWGEFFIRGVVAYDISAIIQYTNSSLETAANRVIYQKLQQIGGNGGVIAVDRQGNIAIPFNTSGMYRAYAKSTGQRQAHIYKS